MMKCVKGAMLCFLILLGGIVWCGGGAGGRAWANPETELFQGFRQYVRAQIIKDKREFSIADVCTVWFYQRQHRQPKAEVQEVRYTVLQQMDPTEECAKRYPRGLEAAREGFGKAQQELSLSLTFFQMALVGDGDDNQQYSEGEIRDVLEAFGLPFQPGVPLSRYMADLTNLFDQIRSDIQFKFLMESLQALMKKGYRFTGADQTALNKELQ
jgi:hypothetical protein